MTRKMMTVVTVLVCCLAATLAVVAAVDPKPNFSGDWTMAVERSFGQAKDMRQTMTVTQTEDQITVETKLILPDNERVVKDTYMLDGKEYDFTPQVPLNAPPNTPLAKGKRTVTWLPNDTGMLVTEVITNETPKGPTTTQIVRKWILTSDGDLAITNFIDTPTGGSYETKRVFVKK
jgi:hypothetical protein